MFRALATATLVAAIVPSASAELIRDSRNNLTLGPDYINVSVNEFETGGHPTTWYVLDGAINAYAPEANRISLGPALYPGTGRQSFWIPKSQPTFYLLGYAPPFPLDYGFRGLTFHSLATEASGGASSVVVTPGAAGEFNYNSIAGSRDVTLPVLPTVPEPSSAILAGVAAVVLIRCPHCRKKQADKGQRQSCDYCGTFPMPSYSSPRESSFHPANCNAVPAIVRHTKKTSPGDGREGRHAAPEETPHSFEKGDRQGRY